MQCQDARLETYTLHHCNAKT